jgi:alkylation response protein AidB-like acyl-CoA dehydrogenase
VVDADQEGLTVAEPESKMGMWASPTAQLIFEDAPVPADRLLGGEEGGGFGVAMASLDGGRLGIAACAVGLSQAALDVALAYAREREQFGRPIVEFQGVSFLLADMATRTEAARTLYRSAADRRDHGYDVTKVAAMSKLFATDAACRPRPTPCRSSAGTATRPSSPSSATSVRRRCCRSSRAPTRSSGW